MLKQLIYILILGVLTEHNNVLGSGFGKCPNYPSMPKYNMTQFYGNWYEVERSFYLPEIALGCTILTFQPIDDESIEQNTTEPLQIEIAVKTVNQWTGNPSISLGYATRSDNKSSILDFLFKTSIPTAIARFLPGNGRYQILYTDYQKFAILYSCANFTIAYSDQIWLLGRDRDFPVEIRKRIYEILAELGLDSERLMISKNKNCPSSLR